MGVWYNVGMARYRGCTLQQPCLERYAPEKACLGNGLREGIHNTIAGNKLEVHGLEQL
jgi:hypothetical protein